MQQQQASEANPVSSFEAGIISVQSQKAGMCIKFRMFDGSDITQHYPLPQFSELLRGLTEYVNSGRHTKFFFRAHEDNSLVANLNPRHPYHTLLTEKPGLTEDEIGGVNKQSMVADVVCIDRGMSFILRCTYVVSGGVDIPMHEYTAFSLLGYLQEIEAIYSQLSKVEGTKH